ncbi:NAD(P)H-binding protein [Streptomyces sp. DSM 41527]|uniref:NAD(P)H-binding protein n=1 Tax=Streptomyces mooreae TaxID=3075523 RepID=A0ABU2TAC2_9ACTN|nr:NAD(P)H-binding protein [Streptomyces sp. DSM 41527]MDT0457898.1 NAD(P)H-binding protein [Streptomyces sp. DSM 41527]
MKIAVIGGTGLIGSQVVKMLTTAGHEAVPQAQSTGVDLLTGEGLPQALTGVDVVVNLTNSPTFDDASLAFFQKTMDHLLTAAEQADVGHVVILSIVGVDEVPDLDYYRAKVLQENVLKAGPVPYSIVRATQFFEFMDAVLTWTADEETVRLPATPVQPIASADVARAVADVAVGSPLRGIHSVAGADVFPLDELGRLTLAARGDRRTVTTDDTAGMFAAVPGDALLAKDDAHIAPTRYRDWISAGDRL